MGSPREVVAATTTGNDPAAPSDAKNGALRSGHKKIDKRILIWYSVVYLIMRMHVSNISNTAIMNLEQGDGIREQLGNLTSGQWAWCLSIFYYPYMCFEPLANLALKKFSPSVWMARIMLTWGIVSMCQGATQNYAGLLACRFFLGLSEAGFYPGVLYHLSFWYPAERLPLRIGFFYACGMFSGTISGLLAYAISFMNGAAGLAGWRWLFILEGTPIILCSVYTFFFLPNYPETSKFLTGEERDAILNDLPEAAPTMTAETFNWQQVKQLFKAPSFVPFTLIWIFHGIGAFGITFVLPTVIYELGISDTAISQVMTMPPSTLNFFLLISVAYLIHTKRLNAWVAGLGMEATQIVCYILLITVTNPRARYIFVMIAFAGSQSFYPIIWPERIRAAKGTTSAALAIGITNGVAQVMGIVGPQLYQPKFGPTYRVSYSCSIGLLCASLCAISTSWYLVRRADQKERAAAELERDDSDGSSTFKVDEKGPVDEIVVQESA